MRINFIQNFLTYSLLLFCIFQINSVYAEPDTAAPVTVDINPDRAQAVPINGPNTAVAQLHAQENARDQAQALQQGRSFVTNAPDANNSGDWETKNAPAAAEDTTNNNTTSVPNPDEVAAARANLKAIGDAQDKPNTPFANVSFTGSEKTANETQTLETASVKPAVLALAGTRWYATMAGGADSYVPGPVRVQIQEGPFAGAYALGNFQVAPDGEHVVLKFDTLATDKTSLPIAAVAVDPSSEVSGLTGNVDHHFLTRFIIPGTVGFFQGAINLLKANQNVVVNGDTSTVSGPQLSNAQLALLMGSTAADRLQPATEPQGVLRLPQVKIPADAALGFLLTKSIESRG